MIAKSLIEMRIIVPSTYLLSFKSGMFQGSKMESKLIWPSETEPRPIPQTLAYALAYALL